MITCPMCRTPPRDDLFIPMTSTCKCRRFRCVPRTSEIHDVVMILGLDWEFREDPSLPFGLGYSDGNLSHVGSDLRVVDIPEGDEAAKAVEQAVRVALASDVMSS